ncbi:hypothetical protein [Ruficoccus sp. ZRK36]|uniref:hypothetical protein n=1 Tax=Ruficoccus sp. ZRK36 TaxID=2866311 RepID=UPI001C72DBB6|nr:hypothetical protein [Ruficoccus sp. ZRK36]QYY34736.1 hypothetical protein K0V07_10525 [Ruficoccus sp. ZRK36]
MDEDNYSSYLLFALITLVPMGLVFLVFSLARDRNGKRYGLKGMAKLWLAAFGFIFLVSMYHFIRPDWRWKPPFLLVGIGTGILALLINKLLRSPRVLIEENNEYDEADEYHHEDDDRLLCEARPSDSPPQGFWSLLNSISCLTFIFLTLTAIIGSWIMGGEEYWKKHHPVDIILGVTWILCGFYMFTYYLLNSSISLILKIAWVGVSVVLAVSIVILLL